MAEQDDELTPQLLLNRIGAEWARLNRTNSNSAWAYLQDELMCNMGLLVPHTTSLKDLISQGLDIKKALHEAGTTKEMNPVQVLASFLNQGTPPADTEPAEDLIQ